MPRHHTQQWPLYFRALFGGPFYVGTRVLSEYPQSLSSSELALRVLELLNDPSAWVRRRIERIDILDEGMLRRFHSVDLVIPEEPPLVAASRSRLHCLLPLTWLRKRDLVNFDLRDEGGIAIPVVGASSHREIAAQVLTENFRLVLARDPTTAERNDILDLVMKRPPSNDEALSRLIEPVEDAIKSLEGAIEAGKAEESVQQDAAKRAAAEDLLELIYRFAENFVLFTVVAPEPGQRRILKFAYDERYELQYGSQREADAEASGFSFRAIAGQLARRLGLLGIEVSTETPSAVNTIGYHFEMHAPSDIEFIDSGLVVTTAEGIEKGYWSPPPAPQRVHLRSSELDPGLQVRATVLLRAATGWLSSALAMAWIVAALLWIGDVRLDAIVAPSRSATPPVATTAAPGSSRAQASGTSTSPTPFTTGRGRTSTTTLRPGGTGRAAPTTTQAGRTTVRPTTSSIAGQGSSNEVQMEIAAGLFFALTGAVTTVLVHRGEHPVLVRILNWPRRFAVLSALLPLVAAGTIVFLGGDHDQLDLVWRCLAVLALVLAALLTLAVLVPNMQQKAVQRSAETRAHEAGP